MLVFTFGQLFLAESVSLSKALGVASIVVGMVLMNRGGPELSEKAQTSADRNPDVEVATLSV